MTAELGRQPWLIYGLLRTKDGAKPDRARRLRAVHADRLSAVSISSSACSSCSWSDASCTTDRSRAPAAPSRAATRRWRHG